jgi:AraC-like DNA-binding protein
VCNTLNIAPKQRYSLWVDKVHEEYGGLLCTPEDMKTFQGKLASSVRGSVSFSEVKCSGQLLERNAIHLSKPEIEKTYKVIILVRGYAECNQLSNAATMSMGDYVILDSEEEFRLRFFGEYHALVIQVKKSDYNTLFQESDLGLVVQGGIGLGLLASQLAMSILSQNHNLDETSVDLSVMKLFDLIEMSLRQSVNTTIVDFCENKKTKAVKIYIEKNIHDITLNPQSIARAFNMSVRSLHSLFKEQNTTLCRHIRDTRLDVGKKMLLNSYISGDSINFISYTVGFKNAAHFSKCFKEKYGRSPSQFLEHSLK